MPLSDDILIEVLKWLTADKLFEFKRVCKRWNEIISGNYFGTIYQIEKREQDNSQLTPLGFYRIGEYAFTPTASRNLTEKAAPYFKIDDIYFVDSYNGLLLFHYPKKRVYRLCNPVTKKWRDIDEPFLTAAEVAVAFHSPFQKLGFESLNNLVITFLVASCYRIYTVYTLSPRSTVWTRKSFRSVLDISFEHCERAMVINGVFYWLINLNSILSYNMSVSQVLSVRVLSLPEKNHETKDVSSVLGKSVDGLLQYIRSYSSKIVVWVRVLNSLNYNSDNQPQSRWVFRYVVSFEQLRNKFPKVHQFCTVEDISSIRYAKLVACHPSNPKIVFVLLNEIIISYCFESNKVELVQRIQGRNKKSGDSPPRKWSGRIVPYFSPTWAAAFLKTPFVVDAECSDITQIETHKAKLSATPWLDALLCQAPLK